MIVGRRKNAIVSNAKEMVGFFMYIPFYFVGGICGAGGT
jgi:hypothetical protein